MNHVKCPACDGYGKRERPAWMADGTDSIECIACHGRGLLYEIDLEALAAAMKGPTLAPTLPWINPAPTPPWIDPVTMPGVYG